MRQPLGRQRQHQRLDPVQTALALADDHRLEAGVAVARHVELDRTDLGDHRLGPLLLFRELPRLRPSEA